MLRKILLFLHVVVQKMVGCRGLPPSRSLDGGRMAQPRAGTVLFDRSTQIFMVVSR